MSTAAPLWAQDLALQVALDTGREDLPEIVWRRSRSKHYSTGQAQFGRPGQSGRASCGRIVITAGTNEAEQKQVLLHELSHWLCPAGEHHGARFYATAWRLYRRYGVSLAQAFERESAYRRMAAVMYFRTAGGALPELEWLRRTDEELPATRRGSSYAHASHRAPWAGTA